MHPAAAALALGLALGLVVGGCGGDDEDESEPQAEAAALEGVPWVLSSGLDVEGWEQAAPSVTFEDGTVGGSTGCNRFTASYTVDGDAVELGMIASTQIACPPPADAVERAYVEALGRVAGWRLDGEELVLLDEDDAEVLRYAAASPVGDWEVTAFLNGDAVSSPLPGTTLTATFGDDGTLSGLVRLQPVHDDIHDRPGRHRDRRRRPGRRSSAPSRRGSWSRRRRISPRCPRPRSTASTAARSRC